MAERTETVTVRSYGAGPFHDEGGQYDLKSVQVPIWMREAKKHCGGCHQAFYNGRINVGGMTNCWSLKPEFAKRKSRPPCWISE